MIYFDAAYVAKCYLNEPGAGRVRALARKAPGLSSCEWARIEFTCIIQRHLRETNITAREARAVLADFRADEAAGVWQWLPVTSELIRKVCERVTELPRRVYLRAGDAVHLVCAKEHGFSEVYTNDRHMLTGCRYFGLSGVNVVES